MGNIDYTKNPLVKYIEDDNKYRGNYFIYGEGGMGKSTSMLMLFNFFLEKAINGKNIVPIYIDSKRLDFTYEKPVFEYIIREYCGLNKDISNHIETLNDLLKNSDKKYYIIIDAINEAESNKYKVICDIAVLKEIFDKNPVGKIIVSSRIDEKVDCFNDFKKIKMLDFTDEQIISFLNQHDFKNNGESIGKIDIEKINPNLLKILRVPMFLKIFKEVYKDANIFPAIYTKNIVRQSDLLEKFVDKIIEDKIDIHKAENSPEYLQCFFSLKRFLPALAFELVKNDEFTIDDSSLDDLFQNKFNESYFKQFRNRREKYFKFAGSFDDLLDECIDDFSFIVCKGENKNVEYSFSHQVWRDYFCAAFLVTAMSYDVTNVFEYQVSSNIQQYIGEIIKEYEFENKTDILLPMSPIEAFMQRNSNVLTSLAVHLCVEIMKKSRNGKITALYDNLDLKCINFYDYNLQGSSFNNAKVYEHNFISPGHTDRVNFVSYSPDGKRILSGSTDLTIRIWDSATGMLIRMWHTDCVFAASYSSDGKRIVSGGGLDGTIQIWDVETGKQIGKPLIGHKDAINSISYSPNGKRIVSGSWDKTIRIWNPETGVQIGEPLTNHTDRICYVSYLPDGKRIVSGSYDKTIRIWDVETGKQIGKPLIGHKDAINSISYSPDGKRIVSGSYDKTIRIWDVETGKQIGKPLIGHKDAINSISYSPDGKRIVSGSYDKTIRIWDVETGKQIGKPLIGHKGTINSISYSPDGKRIVSGSVDKTLRIWDVNTGKQVIEPITNNISRIQPLTYSQNGKCLFSGSLDGTIHIWNIDTGKLIDKLFIRNIDYNDTVSYSLDGKVMIVCRKDGTIRIWNTMTGKQIRKTVINDITPVNTIIYLPDKKQIIIGDIFGPIQIWDAITGKQIGKTLTGHKNFVNLMLYLPDTKRIVSCSYDNTIRIWNAITGEQIGKLCTEHLSFITSLSYSSKGKMLVSGDSDGTIRIWDTEKDKQIGESLIGHKDAINSISYSPDGKRIVSGSRDKTIRIWNAENRSQIGETIMGHSASVDVVSYSPDEKRIVSGSRDGTIRIWDLETHLCTVLNGIIQSNIQVCDFRNAIFNVEDIKDFCHILYCNGADVPKEYEPKPIPFEWNDEELDDKESE